MTRLAVFISTFGYIGRFPFAQGTVGSAAGVAIYLLGRPWTPVLEAVAIAVLFVAGVLAGGRAERHLGSVDPGPVVIDEVMGMLLTFFLIPVGWGGLALGFFIFRICDILKPYPAWRLERLPGGLGIMADDAAAAIYSNLLLRAAWWLVPAWVM